MIPKKETATEFKRRTNGQAFMAAANFAIKLAGLIAAGAVAFTVLSMRIEALEARADVWTDDHDALIRLVQKVDDIHDYVQQKQREDR